MPEPLRKVLRELGVDPDKVTGFVLSWDEYDGAKLEFRLQPSAELVEIEITKEISG
jgi:hypothetical protein